MRALIPICCALVLLAAPACSRPATRNHWAFIPPKRPAVPQVKEASWVRNPIDAFILARLERQGLPHARRGRSGDPVAPVELRLDRFAADASTSSSVSRRHFADWPTSAWSIGCSPARNTASAGGSTGSTWRGSPRPTASSSTRPGPTPGAIATGSSRHSTATCRTTSSSACSSPATRCGPTIPGPSSPPGSIAAIPTWST